MKIEKKDYIWGSLCTVLLLALGWVWHENEALSRETDARLAELEGYQENEGKSYVVERISQQMEDIAYQQKDIAEKQREEAVFQMGVADSMRLRAEEEQRNAQEFARNMVEARNMAEEQRERAIQQQRQAEYARRFPPSNTKRETAMLPPCWRMLPGNSRPNTKGMSTCR